jgi:hypothetical protein
MSGKRKEKDMGRERDKECPSYEGIKARKHALETTSSGRFRYPFKRMIINDYFVVDSWNMAQTVRDALKSLYKRKPSLKFSVRQAAGIDGVWIVRRIG